MKKKQIFAAVCLALIGGFVLASSYYRKQKAAQLGFMAQKNAETFVRAHSPTLGDDAAKVYLVKFTDPACETCASFSDFVKQIMAAYPGKIKLVIRYTPFHEGAGEVAAMLEGAKRQGRFWETLDALYASQGYWTQHHQVIPERAFNIVGRAGVDKERLKKDMKDPAIAEAQAQDLADAASLGVDKTPGFFVNGKPLVVFGARELQALIESELAAAYPR
ncbi:MAG: thioredoxin domain-containing protein [Elusimicrobiota bacterium]|nr:thioredoxin domain-containing protein [Elusimicrobiota bacterium]